MYVITSCSHDMMHDEEVEEYGGHRLGGRSTVPFSEAVPAENVSQQNVADAGTQLSDVFFTSCYIYVYVPRLHFGLRIWII